LKFEVALFLRLARPNFSVLEKPTRGGCHMLRFMQKGRVVLFASICFIFSGTSAFAQDVPTDYQEVLKFLDRKGDYKAGVLKVNIPRNDLKIAIQGFSTPTPFGFGGWIALTKGAEGSDVMMGDLD
jgi:uncharacterized protein DUF1259